MPDETTPAGQETSQQQINQGNPIDWEARYKGLSRKFDELTRASEVKDGTIADLTTQLEQLKTQISTKDAEKNAAVSQRDKTIQESVQAKTTLEQELAELRAFKLKVEVARELKKPNLLRIIDKIPNMENKEALTSVMTDFASFADEAALERERQLTAGIVSNTSAAAQRPGTPGSEAEWERHINSFPLGSQQRQEAFDQYWTWLEAKHKTQ